MALNLSEYYLFHMVRPLPEDPYLCKYLWLAVNTQLSLTIQFSFTFDPGRLGGKPGPTPALSSMSHYSQHYYACTLWGVHGVSLGLLYHRCLRSGVL